MRTTTGNRELTTSNERPHARRAAKAKDIGDDVDREKRVPVVGVDTPTAIGRVSDHAPRRHRPADRPADRGAV